MRKTRAEQVQSSPRFFKQQCAFPGAWGIQWQPRECIPIGTIGHGATMAFTFFSYEVLQVRGDCRGNSIEILYSMTRSLEQCNVEVYTWRNSFKGRYAAECSALTFCSYGPPGSMNLL